jgi:hypothetical protein
MNPKTAELSKNQKRVISRLEREAKKLDRLLSHEAELRAKYPKSTVVNDMFGPEKTEGGEV